MASIPSPRPPIEEMTTLAAGPGAVGFARRVERCAVSWEREVEGGMAGRDGVRRPFFGSKSKEPISALSRYPVK